MKKWSLLVVSFLLFAVMLAGCGSTETKQQKLDAFKKAHAAIYDAWAAQTMDDLKTRLSAGLADPLLSEQVKQQSNVMNLRLMMNEKHLVKSITYNQLDITEDGSDSFTAYCDWTVDGLIDHGDIHEQKVSYKKHFHATKQNGVWKLDKMTD